MNLNELVRIYNKNYKRKFDYELLYYNRLNSLDEAIEKAALAITPSGKMHRHQWRIGKKILSEAKETLLSSKEEVKNCKSFEQLINLIKQKTEKIKRFGELALYDTSLRIGSYLNILPKAVYLHAGTRKGCKNLLKLIGQNLTNRFILDKSHLPKELRALEEYDIENFLCIWEKISKNSEINVVLKL